MPRIFDNIEQKLLPTLMETLEVSDRADFCVGYFNLRGWKQIDAFVDKWDGGEENCCRLLIGMQRHAQDILRDACSLLDSAGMDNQTALRMKKKIAEEFRNQLTLGTPTNNDEIGLRRLAAQLKAKKVICKFFLRHPLHAKLYLLFRPDPINPKVGYLGSSNLTLAGLYQQGELNIDVLDHDACDKLAQWFEDRWNDRWCLDISEELVHVIDESWAREDLIPPYHIYLKMAYHLSREARTGLTEFKIPREFRNVLLDYQTAAVKIAAHHLNKRGGVIIGDVVGLGKTLMATALARIFEDDFGLETLVICPKNLVKMWNDHVHKYRLRAKVISITGVINDLPKLPRYRLVLIDESHNLRNREGRRYKVIHEYIQKNDSKCILLTATPYNKTYHDLSKQLRLFVDETVDIGIRPEQLLNEMGETEFIRQHQCPIRSLAAFEKSEFADDWRELMRLYLVRRTRSFIIDNYAKTDESIGQKYLLFPDGSRSYFPTRKPKTLGFKIDESNPDDQYARLYATDIVDTINNLQLPRYGLGVYVEPDPENPPTSTEEQILMDLSRAGKRLMGFCRTNLFKRLESGGQAFIQSVERHIIRNYLFCHAIDSNEPLPVGTHGVNYLDGRFYDEDEDSQILEFSRTTKESELRQQAAEIYNRYRESQSSKFRWTRPDLFKKELGGDLEKDSNALLKVLELCGTWDSEKDEKLKALEDMLKNKHPNEKVIVFTQFADTVRYLEEQLEARGLDSVAGVTGDTEDPTEFAYRFSPKSNEENIEPEDQLRVLIATDVLSEGQNLQDCAIVVNYDLPWAIIRLIQRAGRVDRIGQEAETLLIYTFLPADGVERIIQLRSRVRTRLDENKEVVGTDEAFFEDDRIEQGILDIYNEKAEIFDEEDNAEVDLASQAYEIWKRAIDKDPSLKKTIPNLAPVVYSTKSYKGDEKVSPGVLLYMRTGEGYDALTWLDGKGTIITESQFQILKAAECSPDEPALPRSDNHHDLVQKGVNAIVKEESNVGGQLGRPSGARFKTYERLKNYSEQVKGTFDYSPDLIKTIEDIYSHPLLQTAIDTLNRQLRAGVSDADLAQIVINLRDDDRLCVIHKEVQKEEPTIICSMGLKTVED